MKIDHTDVINNIYNV